MSAPSDDHVVRVLLETVVERQKIIEARLDDLTAGINCLLEVKLRELGAHPDAELVSSANQPPRQ